MMLGDFIRHAAEGARIGVISIDVDNFRDFNEYFGHLTADEMLVTLARTIESCVAREGSVAREGGDEFLILVPDYSAAQTLELAETVRQCVAAIATENHVKLLSSLTLTLGVACFPDDGKTALEVVEEADLAVTIGKNHGRDRVVPARNPLRRDAPPY